MGAEAPGFTFRIKEDGLLKAKLHAAGNVSAIRCGGNLAPGNFFVGHSGNGEATICLNDILGCRLQQVRGDTASLFNDPINCDCQGPATRDGAALPKVPTPCGTTRVSPCRITT